MTPTETQTLKAALAIVERRAQAAETVVVGADAAGSTDEERLRPAVERVVAMKGLAADLRLFIADVEGSSR